MSKIKIYKASAGSGKTYTLASEYIRELLSSYHSDAYRNILAVTFTKDATGEMKSWPNYTVWLSIRPIRKDFCSRCCINYRLKTAIGTKSESVKKQVKS